MPDYAELTYCKLTYLANSIVADTVGVSGDEGTKPDLYAPWMDAMIEVWVAGSPRTPEIRLPEADPPRTVMLIPIDARVEAGVFRLRGQTDGVNGVEVVAKSAIMGLGDIPLLCTVTFGPTKIGGRSYQYDPVTFILPTVEPGDAMPVLDLTTVERVDTPPSTPNELVVRMVPDEVRQTGDTIRFYSSGLALAGEVELPQGDQGDQGPAGTINVGDVTTGAPGSAAAVDNSGTASAAVLDFTIPRGDTGAQGLQGIPGSATITGLGDATTISRRVCITASGGSTTEDGANTWTKIATVTISGSRDFNLSLAFVGSYLAQDAAGVNVAIRAGGIGAVPTILNCEMLYKTGTGGRIGSDSFKFISSAADAEGFTTAELWMKKIGALGEFAVWELGRHTYTSAVNAYVVYHDLFPWQSAVPTGAAEAATNGVTAFGQRVVTHDAATFPSTLVSTTGAQTLTNKTISGASNTVTNLPASATPSAARLVGWTASGGATTENGANTWAKIATITHGVAQFASTQMLLSVTGMYKNSLSGDDSAVLSVHVSTNTTSANPTISVQYLAKGGAGSILLADSFKLVNNGWGTDIELWVKKGTTYGGIRLYELSVSGNAYQSIVYHSGAAWQSATPTGSLTAVSNGVTAFGNPVGVKVSVPSTATSTGTPGQWAADADWHYVCAATNTWRRTALSTW